MSTRQMVMAVVSAILKVAIAVAAVVIIYKGAVIAYDYGYRVFKEEPVAEAPGVDIQVDITIGKSTMDIGQILEDKGLIRDAKLFYIQNLLSHYKDKLQPGTYVLNTSMTMEEMMEIMSVVPETTDETDTSEDTTGGAEDDGTVGGAEDEGAGAVGGAEDEGAGAVGGAEDEGAGGAEDEGAVGGAEDDNAGAGDAGAGE